MKTINRPRQDRHGHTTEPHPRRMLFLPDMHGKNNIEPEEERASGRALGQPSGQATTPATTAAATQAPSRTRPIVGLALYLGGLVLLGIGLGLAAYQLLKAGLTPVAAVGLVFLAAGAALIILGVRRLWRATPRRWRLLLVLALLLLAYPVVSPLGQAVVYTVVPPIPLGSETPADRGLEADVVTFPAADGVRLAGWYVPGRNGAAVVLLHGAGSTRTAVLDHAEVLARHGYGVLLYDARGHGASEGRAMELGWYGDLDVAGAVDFLAARPDVDPDRIAAAGMSMGAEQVIGAAAADPRIQAVVAEGATQRVAGDAGWLPRVYGLRGWLTLPVEQLTTALTDLLTPTSAPMPLREAAGTMAPRPLLLISAGTVPAEGHAAAWIREGAPTNVAVWEAPDATHTGALELHPDEWEERVIGFLDAKLLPHGAD